MGRRRKRVLRRTLLAVGEGHTEIAFLKHLRSIYCTGGNRSARGPKVTIRNAHGKGPEHILNTALVHQKQADYDSTIILLDTDIPWPNNFKRDAKKCNVFVIGSQPCIEAVFLAILNIKVPKSTKECERAAANYLGYDLTEPLRHTYLNLLK